MTDTELILKKTARRRLVGAVTLVILMLIVLPFVLKDRVADLAQEEVKVTVVNEEVADAPPVELPQAVSEAEDSSLTADQNKVEAQVEPKLAEKPVTPAPPAPTAPTPAVSNVVAQPSVVAPLPASLAANPAPQSAPMADKPNPASAEPTKAIAAVSQVATPAPSTKPIPQTNIEQVKPLDKKNTEIKAAKPSATSSPAKQVKEAAKDKREAQKNVIPPSETPAEKASADKKTGHFFVQFGVFTDPNNLDSLRQKLAQSGIESVVEPVGAGQEKFKLRSQMYSQRADAVTAQAQMQALGVSGIVVGK